MNPAAARWRRRGDSPRTRRGGRDRGSARARPSWPGEPQLSHRIDHVLRPLGTEVARTTGPRFPLLRREGDRVEAADQDVLAFRLEGVGEHGAGGAATRGVGAQVHIIPPGLSLRDTAGKNSASRGCRCRRSRATWRPSREVVGSPPPRAPCARPRYGCAASGPRAAGACRRVHLPTNRRRIRGCGAEISKTVRNASPRGRPQPTRCRPRPRPTTATSAGAGGRAGTAPSSVWPLPYGSQLLPLPLTDSRQPPSSGVKATTLVASSSKSGRTSGETPCSRRHRRPAPARPPPAGERSPGTRSAPVDRSRPGRTGARGDQQPAASRRPEVLRNQTDQQAARGAPGDVGGLQHARPGGRSRQIVVNGPLQDRERKTHEQAWEGRGARWQLHVEPHDAARSPSWPSGKKAYPPSTRRTRRSPSTPRKRHHERARTPASAGARTERAGRRERALDPGPRAGPRERTRARSPAGRARAPSRT